MYKIKYLQMTNKTIPFHTQKKIDQCAAIYDLCRVISLQRHLQSCTSIELTTKKYSTSL